MRDSKARTLRPRAEKLISDGAQLLVGAFDSGQTTAIAQVAEQKGIPLVIVLGPEEIAAGVAKVKIMASGVERVLPLGEVVAALTVE